MPVVIDTSGAQYVSDIVSDGAGGAIIAIETTNLLSSVVCVGAVGFLLSIAFLFLGSFDFFEFESA